MQVFARRQLVPDVWNCAEPALLLEGGWLSHSSACGRDSLDEAIDARHAWIDDEASRIAELLAADRHIADIVHASMPPSMLAYLDGLRLRYFLVKLLRWVAYCRNVRRPVVGDRWELHAGVNDDDYVDLFQELCRRYRVPGELRRIESCHDTANRPANSPNRCRRTLSSWLASTAEHVAGERTRRPRQRLLLCGDLALLSPLGRAWRCRGGDVACITDEAILKLRFSEPQLRQFVCQGSRGVENRFDPVPRLNADAVDGIDLSRPLTRWLNATRRQFGPRWSRWLWAMDRHFAAWRPDALVLSEDATPFSRAAAWVARRNGVPSIVAQHGAPCLQFGFAPLAADWMAAWDEPSRQQFLDWGLPPEQVVVSGSLALEKSRARAATARRSLPQHTPTALILANLPARDERPDGAAFHLTQATHEAMLRATLTACATVPKLQVIVKLHPRQSGCEPWPRLLAEFPQLHARLVSKGHWTTYLSQSDVVLSCASSAGVEAAQLGWPVVQLLPQGSADILPAHRWGLLGSATTADELRPLLRQSLRTSAHPRQGAGRRACSAVTLLSNFVERTIENASAPHRASVHTEEPLCLRT